MPDSPTKTEKNPDESSITVNQESKPTLENFPADEFKLALTMAGAASAGCYTGGVMDYLFEILDLWERAKFDTNKKNREANLPLKAPGLQKYWDCIPQHKVTIDAIGGTSAGGMTSVMAAIYALNGKINPVTNPGKTLKEIKELKDNIFYDSWVIMDDLNPEDKRETAQKIWDTTDLKELGIVKSLLNSSFIDNIADRCFKYGLDIKRQVEGMPAYISKDIQLILSHCMLRGIPLNVSFTTPIGTVGHKSILPDHTTYEHYVISHYHLNKGKIPTPNYFWLNPYSGEHLEMLKLATKATGAFPAGLVYREFDDTTLSGNLLEKSVKRLITDKIGVAEPDPLNEIELKYLKNYSTVSVDGGAINNEPYREVNCLLKDKYGPFPADNFPRYGVLMIDPFPDKGSFDDEKYEAPRDLLEVAPAILGSLVDQARVKRRELLEHDSDTSFRSIIFPRKWIPIGPKPGATGITDDDEAIPDAVGTASTPSFGNHRPDPNPIACSSAMAFAGLLDIKFREHDFFLGRNNARNFFRYFFSFPYDADPVNRHPIHRYWTEEMVNKFIIEKKVKKKVDGEWKETFEKFLPIIPDLNFLTENSDNIGDRRYDFDIPAIPKYDPQRLFDMQPLIKARLLAIINTLPKRGKKLEEIDNKRARKKLTLVEAKIKKAEDKLVELRAKDRTEENTKAIDNKVESNLKLEKERKALRDKIAGVVDPTNADRWIKKEYGSNWFSRKIMAPAGNLFLGIVFLLSRGKIANKMANAAISKVLKDLDKGKCLKEMED